MTLTAPRNRPTVTTRRAGYVAGVLVNAVLLYAANVWPGWQAVPFLTADTALVMGLVNAAIIVNLAADAAYLITDPRWFKAMGTVVTSIVGFLAAARIWMVFPFDFDGSAVDWSWLVRIVLGVAMVGSAIAAIVSIVSLVGIFISIVTGSDSAAKSATTRSG